MPSSTKIARITRRLLLVVATFATLIALGFVFENWRGRRAWLAYDAAQQARGSWLSDFPPPSHIPAAENFLCIPPLDRLLFSPSGDEEVGAYVKPLPFGYPAQHDWTQGMRFDPSRFMVGQAKMSRHTTAQQTKAQPPATMADVVRFLAPVNTRLAAFRSALRLRPRSEAIRPAADGVKNSLGARTLNYQIIIRDPTALNVQACVFLADGSNELALEDTLAILRFGRGLLDMTDSRILDSLMGCSVVSTSFQSVWEGTRGHRWNEAQLARLQAELAQVHILTSLDRGLDIARLSAGLELDTIHADLYHFGSPMLHPSRRWNWRKWVPVPRGWFDLNNIPICESIRMNRDLLRAAGTSEFLGKRGECVAFGKFLASQRRYSPGYSLARSFGPMFGQFLIGGVHEASNVDLAITACALERYRLAHSAYPESLDSLVPAFLPSVPKDLIDGKPLRYSRIQGDSYKLYSIGSNGVDDGGTVAKGPSNFTPEADWCWPEMH